MTNLALVAASMAASAASVAQVPIDTPVTAALDWDLVLKALGFLATVGATAIQVKNLRAGSRSSLKTDLEILNLIDSSHPAYASVKSHTDTLLGDLYPTTTSKTPLSAERIAIGIFGLLWSIGFSYWTFRLSTPEFSWWSLGTGYIALMGLAWIGMAITGAGLSTTQRARKRIIAPASSDSGSTNH